MENTEIKSGTKEVKNHFVLKNLTRRQKELLSSAGVIFAGIGLGGGLFSLYSLDEPNTIPKMQNPDDMESPQGNLGSLASANVINPQEEQNESVILHTKNPVQEISDENLPFSEAFKIARSINGPGGWFIWKDNVYNTYYKEEWQSMPQSEKNEYLASLDVQSKSDIMQPVVNAEIIAEPIEIEQVEIEDITNAEIITLDDDIDLKQQGVFELSEDIEITVLSDNESIKLDSVIIDSSQITEFPWGETVNEMNVQIPDNDTSEIIFNEEIKNESASVSELSEVEEYPWGEPVEHKEPTVSVSLSENTIAAEETINPVVIDPKGITEYPWGEPVGTEALVAETVETGIIVDSAPSIDIQSAPVLSFQNVEEFPWGEKNIHYEPVTEIVNSEITGEILRPEVESENVGIIVTDVIEPIFHSQLPPSFNDVTEFPWGESILDSQIGLNEETDNGDDSL
ncbi:MAG: hypothetical protein Q8R96_10955 [Bacteroidota bacterium]|nr:hypothetical protein [Bacteroidota bacterium]